MPTQYEMQEEFIGPDGFVRDLQTSRVAFKALLGTENMQEIQDVYTWFTGVPPYLWRVNSKPREKDERVAGFFAGSDRANLDCVRDPLDSGAGLGVFACATGAPDGGNP